jgi:nucleotide-binding universal stress UspA family protein
MYTNILLANDTSIDAHGALIPAISLARAFKARLTMLVISRRHLIPTLMAEVDEARVAAKTKADFLASVASRQAQDAGVTFHLGYDTGPLAERTLAYIEANRVDLLVIGLARKSRLLSVFDTMDLLFRNSSCSIHVVKDARR